MIPGVAQHVPYLRRYARALTGSQHDGDGCVQATLEGLVAGRLTPDLELTPRAALFKAFHQTWRPDDEGHDKSHTVADDRLQHLAPLRRAALLLSIMEGFTTAQSAAILGLSQAAVEAGVREALAEIDGELATRVLIIEDEPIIALDLERMVTDLGHQVVGVAQTRAEGVALAQAHAPGLVLADVHLADGSSGLDTAGDILAEHDVPIIFVTAYPERLLTGARPEPAYLVSKPYEEDQVRAVIGQALFFHRPRAVAAAA